MGWKMGLFHPWWPGSLHNTGSTLTPRPPLSPKEKWHLLRVAPENLRTYQTSRREEGLPTGAAEAGLLL